MIVAKKASLFSNLIGLLPFIITWSLWTNRCKAKMEGIKYNIEKVWRKIKTWTQILAHDLMVYKSILIQDLHVMSELHIPKPKINAQKCIIVR